MSLDEANEIVLDFDRADYSLPKRTVDNILNDVDIRVEIERASRVSFEGVPEECTRENDQLYVRDIEELNRTIASRPLGRSGRSGRNDLFISHQKEVFDHGYYEEGIETLNRALKSVPSNYAFDTASLRSILAFRQLTTGDLGEALDSAARARNRVYRARHQATSWVLAPHIIAFHETLANGITSEITGKLHLAEAYYRHLLTLQGIGSRGISKSLVRGRLAQVLLLQYRLNEAEAEIRQAIDENFGSTSTQGMLLTTLAAVLFEQGRFLDSELVARAALKLFDSVCVPRRSFIYANARSSLAAALSTQEKWQQAIDEYNAIEFEHGFVYPRSYRRLFASNLESGLALVRYGFDISGQERIEAVYQRLSIQLGDDHVDTAIALGHLAIAYFELGRIREARDSFNAAMSVLLDNRHDRDRLERDSLRESRLRNVLEGYIKFLSHGYADSDTSLNERVVDELFLVADIARSGVVETAMAAANARAVRDPELANLVRQEQDLRMQIRAIRALIISYRSDSSNAKRSLIEEADERLTVSILAQNTLLEEINSKFPAYAEKLYPRAGTVRDVRRSLKDDEVLIAFYSSFDRTLVWAIPKRGEIGFHVSKLDRKRLGEKVESLRISLDPGVTTLDEIPDFDLKSAFNLYDETLGPLEAIWKNARSLVVVSHGALAQLPLGVLPVEQSRVQKSALLFSEYRKVPWLARNYPISTIPSIATFREQRYQPVERKHERSFIGFADPTFESEWLPEDAIRTTQKTTHSVSSRGLKLRAPVGTRSLVTANLESLPRLPETATEVRNIALALNANLQRDLFLGLEANEENIYRQPLEKYAVVAFATHGLVPGDLDGLRQPALAFSNPAAAGVNGDGLLTLDEILSLKLNADWVVLSACNSAAADGAGAEAISGLGRAFFYAGAKSLLVTHWPVETSSASELTSNLFRWQSANPQDSRSAALQHARLQLIDGPGYLNSAGQTVFAYAHPLFWAPFALIGW